MTDPPQLADHSGIRVLDWLLDVAKDPNGPRARVNGRPVVVTVTILVWGATTPAGHDGDAELRLPRCPVD
jgi:hypothetical protein